MSEIKKKKTDLVVLVVEDNLDIRELYRQYFETKGLKVELARNGREGLKRLDSIKADLILTDINMEVMDGNEFCERVLIERKSAAPIVAVTAKPEGATAPFDRIIGKPFMLTELTEVVFDLLQKKG